jgi:hypothetical protein
MTVLGAGIARPATTDVYLDFAFASPPGWQYQNYFDWANRGNTNTLSESPLLAYYTTTGVTGSTKDSFEFWVGVSVGYQNTHGASDSSGWGASSPNIGIEWYYNPIQSDKAFGSEEFEAFSISPWFLLTAPNANTTSAGFGSGANQWSGTGALLMTYRKARFTTTMQPFTLTYAGGNLNSTPVTNPDGSISFAKARAGWSGAFGIINVGYDVTPTFTLGLQQVWNIYSFAGTRYSPRASEGTIGPLFGYSGLSDAYGLYIAGAVQIDYYRSPGLPRSVYVTTYITKHF